MAAPAIRCARALALSPESSRPRAVAAGALPSPPAAQCGRSAACASRKRCWQSCCRLLGSWGFRSAAVSWIGRDQQVSASMW